MKKILGVFTSSLLVLSLLSIAPANADELSDAKAALTAAQAELGAANTSFAQIIAQTANTNKQISGIDPATTDPVQIQTLDALKKTLADLTAQAVTARANATRIQSLIDSLTVQIRILEAASQFGKNCPASWGVTSADLIVGLDTGRFTLASKIMTQVATEPRNIVVSTAVEQSLDGANWTTVMSRPFDYTNSAGYGKKNYIPSWQIYYDAYSLIKVANAKLRVVTTMAKEGCDTVVATSDPVALRTAVPPTNKMDLDLIYATYLPGISNYQERDNLKALLARIKTDFPKAFDQGYTFKLSDGYIGNSSIFVHLQTPNTCSGDTNYITPVVGQSCTISIYWASSNLWALIDVISALGKENSVDKANNAAKAELAPLQDSVMVNFKQVEYIANQINTFSNQINAATQEQFTITQDYLVKMQQTNSSLLSVQNIFRSAIAVANKYTSGEYSEEVMNYAGTIRGYADKYPLSSMQAQLTSQINQATSLLTLSNGESAKTLKDANLVLSDWKSLFEKEVQIIKSYITALDSQKLILNTKEAYSAEKNRHAAALEKLILTKNEYQNRAALAIKTGNSVSNSTERSTWLKAGSAYNSVVELMDKLTSYYPIWLKSIENSYARNSDNVIEDDGAEEDPFGSVSVVKESGGKFLIRVKSNQESSAMVVRATKSGQKTITFRVVTNSVGAASIRTTRKLSGWRITLLFEDEVLARATA
jgi:hypothetical protein